MQNYQIKLSLFAESGQVKQEVAKLKNSLMDITRIPTNNITGQMATKIKEASNAAKELQIHLAGAFNQKTGDFNINKLQSSLQSTGQSLTQLSMNLLKIGPQGTQAFSQLANSILNAQKPAMHLSTVVTKLMATMMNTARWMISSAILTRFISGISSAFNYAKDLNRELTNIRIVTGYTKEEVDGLARSANKMAKELKKSTLEVVKGQLIYQQQGDSMALSAKKAEITIKATATALGASAQEMSNYLTAVWNSYKVGESQLESFVDKANALGARTAVNQQEIFTAMEKSAAAAAAVGVEYDQLGATIATIGSVTRNSAETIGTTLKTVYARIGDLKINGEDEDGIGYGQVSSGLKKLGIDILDAQGDLRDMGEVIEEIGDKYQYWTEAQQAAAVQLIAGKRQYTQMLALFENWDMYQRSLSISENADGELDRQFDAWADSWEGASNRVKVSLETLYSDVISDGAMIGFNNLLADTIEIFDVLIKSVGGFGSVLSGVALILMKLYSHQITAGLISLSENFKLLFSRTNQTKQAMMDSITVQLKAHHEWNTLAASQKNYIINLEKITELQRAYQQQAHNMTSTQKSTSEQILSTIEALNNESIALRQATEEQEKYAFSLTKSKNGQTASQRQTAISTAVTDYARVYRTEAMYNQSSFKNDAALIMSTKATQMYTQDTQKMSEALSLAKVRFGENSEQVKRLEAAIKNGSLSFGDMRMVLKGITSDTKMQEQKLQELARTLGVSTNNQEAFIAAVRQSGIDLANFNRIEDLTEEQIKQLNLILQQTTQIAWTTWLQQGTSALMGLTMALSSVTQLIDVFKRALRGEDVGAMEWITAFSGTLLSMSMLITSSLPLLGSIKSATIAYAGTLVASAAAATAEGIAVNESNKEKVESTAVSGAAATAIGAEATARGANTVAAGAESAVVRTATKTGGTVGTAFAGGFWKAAWVILKSLVTKFRPVLVAAAVIGISVWVYKTFLDFEGIANKKYEEAKKKQKEAEEEWQKAKEDEANAESEVNKIIEERNALLEKEYSETDLAKLNTELDIAKEKLRVQQEITASKEKEYAIAEKDTFTKFVGKVEGQDKSRDGMSASEREEDTKAMLSDMGNDAANDYSNTYTLEYRNDVVGSDVTEVEQGQIQLMSSEEAQAEDGSLDNELAALYALNNMSEEDLSNLTDDDVITELDKSFRTKESTIQALKKFRPEWLEEDSRLEQFGLTSEDVSNYNSGKTRSKGNSAQEILNSDPKLKPGYFKDKNALSAYVYSTYGADSAIGQYVTSHLAGSADKGDDFYRKKTQAEKLENLAEWKEQYDYGKIHGTAEEVKTIEEGLMYEINRAYTGEEDINDKIQAIRMVNPEWLKDAELLEKEFGITEKALSDYAKSSESAAYAAEQAAEAEKKRTAQLKTLGDAIEALSKASEENNKEGKLSYNTIEELRKKYASLGIAVDEYIDKLYDVNGNQAEVNKILNEMSTKALVQEFENGTFNGMSDGEIKAWAEQMGYSTEQANKLAKAINEYRDAVEKAEEQTKTLDSIMNNVKEEFGDVEENAEEAEQAFIDQAIAAGYSAEEASYLWAVMKALEASGQDFSLQDYIDFINGVGNAALTAAQYTALLNAALQSIGGYANLEEKANAAGYVYVGSGHYEHSETGETIHEHDLIKKLSSEVSPIEIPDFSKLVSTIGAPDGDDTKTGGNDKVGDPNNPFQGLINSLDADRQNLEKSEKELEEAIQEAIDNNDFDTAERLMDELWQVRQNKSEMLANQWDKIQSEGWDAFAKVHGMSKEEASVYFDDYGNLTPAGEAKRNELIAAKDTTGLEKFDQAHTDYGIILTGQQNNEQYQKDNSANIKEWNKKYIDNRKNKVDYNVTRRTDQDTILDNIYGKSYLRQYESDTLNYEEYKAYENWLIENLGLSADDPRVIEAQKETSEALKKVKDTIRESLEEESFAYIDDGIKFGFRNDSLIKAWDRTWSHIFDEETKEKFATDPEGYKELVNMTYDKFVDSISSIMEVAQEQLLEPLENRMAKYEGMKTILEKHHEVSNSIRDAQHELNKELQASLTNYQYLDAETRKLLFNEEDYLKLNKELNKSQKNINNLQKEYNDKIIGKTEEQIELITKEYERQYELEMKKYEIAKADLEVTKKKTALMNTLQERNTQMFINGQWTWVADTDAVIQAQNELADAQKGKSDAQDSLSQTLEVQELDRAIDDVQKSINKINKSFEELEKKVSGQDGIIQTLGEFGGSINGTIEFISELISDAKENRESALKGDVSYNAGTGKYYSHGSRGGNVAAYVSGDMNRYGGIKNKDGTYSVKDDLTGNIVGVFSSKDDAKKRINSLNSGYATGTSNAKSGLARVIEQGSELLATKEGFLYEMSGGEMVFNNDQFRFLYEFSKTPVNKMLNGLAHNDNSSVDNSITINGISIDAKSQEGEALKDILTRILGNR